jgi:hypothetical protein
MEVKKAGGGTWFDCVEEEDRIIFDTRKNGDVGEGVPGKADLAEARELGKILAKKFPKHEVSLDCVDEWVFVEIRRTEKSGDKIRREERDKLNLQLSKDWKPIVEEALETVGKACLGENYGKKNHDGGFSWGGTVIASGKSGTTTFNAKYGERYLYRENMNAIPAFKTISESSQHFAKLLKILGGVLRNTRTTKTYQQLTYNAEPPNNIIEDVGNIVYEVELPRIDELKTRNNEKTLSKPKTKIADGSQHGRGRDTLT